MVVLLGILSVAALGGLLYVFFSTKSSQNHKMAALVALILSGLALGICGIILFAATGVQEEEDPYAFTPVVDKAPVSSNINIIEFVLFLVLLVAAFVFIIYLGLKDRKKRRLKEAVVGAKNSEFDPMDDF